MARNTSHFTFDGSTAGYLGTTVLAAFVTVCTLGFGFPFGLAFHQRWKARHSMINGRRLEFTGSGRELLRVWVAWNLMILATLGVYALWASPRVARWTWENTAFDLDWRAGSTSATGSTGSTGGLSAPSRLHLAFAPEVGKHQLAG